MDHEQTFCPGNTYWTGGCTSDHYAVDFTVYVITLPPPHPLVVFLVVTLRALALQPPSL